MFVQPSEIEKVTAGAFGRIAEKKASSKSVRQSP
jgi:hypothetical protein